MFYLSVTKETNVNSVQNVFEELLHKDSAGTASVQASLLVNLD